MKLNPEKTTFVISSGREINLLLACKPIEIINFTSN